MDEDYGVITDGGQTHQALKRAGGPRIQSLHYSVGKSRYFAHSLRNFHKKIGVAASDFHVCREYLTKHRKSDLPEERVDKNRQENRQRGSQSSWETGCLWMGRESSYSE
jgi:hypothetical protein